MSLTDSPAERTADVRLTTQVVRDGAEFDALVDDWAELYAACTAATPFQTHAWLSSWWRHYGTPGDLRLVLVRDGASLVAAAPLFVARRGPFSVLLPVGEGISDYTDVLVADGPRAASAREALVRSLLDEPGWQVLDLPELRPGAAGESLRGVWPGTTAALPSSVSLELPGRPMSETLARLRKDSAKTVRRKLRKADTVGVTVCEVEAESVEFAVDQLIGLHVRQWEGRGMNPEHGSERFAAHLRDALPRMVAAGSATVTEYRVGEDVVICEALVISPGLLGAYLAGMAPEIRQEIDVSIRVAGHNLDMASGRGVAAFSMLRGEEPYKLRLRPDAVVSTRLLLVHPHRRVGGLYGLLVRARAAIIRAAKVRAPWLRPVHSWVTTLGGLRG